MVGTRKFDFDHDTATTHPNLVGQKKPNSWGLYDLHGNVWEWCRDAYKDELSGGTDPFVDGGWDRVVRGGCWTGPPGSCRSACRCCYGYGKEAWRYTVEPGGLAHMVGFQRPSAPQTSATVPNDPPAKEWKTASA